MSRSLVAVARVFGLLGIALPSIGRTQCTPEWRLQGPNFSTGAYASTMWNHGGVPSLVVGGSFDTAGGIRANNIALYHPAANLWSPLGQGVDGVVWAVAVMLNGELIVGGDFTHAGGIPASHIARWDGVQWHALGSGVDSAVRSLLAMPNGDCVAGGSFLNAGTVAAFHVARWNGSAWASVGTTSGFNYGWIGALALMPNGDIVAGGPHAGLQRWNGTMWQSMSWVPSGQSFPEIGDSVCRTLTVTPSGDLVAGGIFYVYPAYWPTPAGFYGLMQWSDSTQRWTYLGNAQEAVFSMVMLPSGTLCSSASQMPGATQSSLLPLNGYVNTMTVLPGSDIFVGGTFTEIATSTGFPVRAPMAGVGRWGNGTWRSSIGDVTDGVLRGNVRVMLRRSSGELVAGTTTGDATRVKSKVARRLTDGRWVSLGAGMGGPGGLVATSVDALAEASNGDIYAGGTFTLADGVAASNVARWDGSSWNSVGAGVGGPVRAIVCGNNGDVFVAGQFTTAGGAAASNIARWDGTRWSALGAGANGAVNAMLRLPNGDILAGGAFGSVGGIQARVGRWNGASWTSYTTSFSNVIEALALAPNGDLIMGGLFDSVGSTQTGIVQAKNIARWDGLHWNAMGSGVFFRVGAITTLPTGDVVIAGPPDGSVPSRMGVAVNRGGDWAYVVQDAAWYVRGMVVDAGDALWVGGYRYPYEDQGLLGMTLQTWTPTCRAISTSYGAGCAASGGTTCVLDPVAGPWAGSNCHARATGLPANGLAVGLWGLGQVQLPLSTQFPQSATGCSLLATSDIVTFSLADNAGSATTDLFVPRNTWLIGATGYHQVVGLDFTSGGPVAVSTNGLRLTVGTY